MAKTLKPGESQENSSRAPDGILDAIRALNDIHNPEGSLQRSFHHLCTALQAMHLRLYRLKENHSLTLEYSFSKESPAAGTPEHLSAASLPPGLLATLARHRSLTSIQLIEEQKTTGFPVNSAHASYFEWHPLATDEQLHAVLALYFAEEPPTQERSLLKLIQTYTNSLSNFLYRQPAVDIDTSHPQEPEEAPEESEAILKAILNALPDLKFRINKEGVFLNYFSSQEENMSLYSPPEEFLNRKIQHIMPAYLSQAIMQNLKKALQSRKVQPFEYPLHVDGAIHYFEARISAINEEEAIAVIRDITELKRTQQELQKKLRELDKNNQKLNKYVDSNLLLENFAHTVSHDLREPIRTINSFSQLLRQKYSEKLDEDASIYLNFIASSASNMNTLIEDLLEYSRFNNSAHELQRVDLNQLLNAVTTSLSGLIADKQADIQIIPLPVVQANWTKVSQLFQNLLSNAIKFSKAGEAPEVKIGAEDKGTFWEFYIEDKGIGIKPEFHQQIFLLFRRLHSKKYYAGSGIGLSLCKRVVEQHGGKIWVDSQPDEGAIFYFTLPK